MRTNIDIDDELMQKAMLLAKSPTKKAAVEEALKLLIRIKGQADIRKWRGKIVWRGPDDDWFASDEEILEKRRAEWRAEEAIRIACSGETPEFVVAGRATKL